jgi:nitrite reductase/ring-hydroxylating ferredoxin subunit
MPKINWFKIADSVNSLPWQTNNMCLINLNNKTYTLAKYNNNILAFAHKCPHASGILANGWLDSLGNVVCPVHRYKFCLKNGRNVSGEGYYLKTYIVEVNETGIFIGIENNNFLSF